MIAYLLKSATCLALLLFFYNLVLEREKMHNFNRFYLLGSVFFSFLAPLYVIYVNAAPIILENTTNSNIVHNTENISSEIIIENTFDYDSILITIYFIISAILCIRLGKNLFNIIHKTKKNITIPYQKAILILVDDQILPHTFWNYIFINKNDYENHKIEKELFTHELTHVTQKHTLDIILLELVHAIFWVNPFFILLKKAVQLNHEFLADERVIHQHKNTTQYQHLLVNKAAWKNEYYLASNLNYSLTKKRLKMMTTQSSHTKILLKKLAVIPLLTGFVYLFAERVEAQEIIEVKEYIDSPVNNLLIKNLDPEDIRVKLKDINNLKNSYFDKDTIIEKNEASEKQMKEYKLLLNDAKEHNMFKLKDIKKMQDIYSLMSEKQKKTVQNISELIPPPPPPVPNASEEEILRAKKAYEVWKKSTGNHFAPPPPPKNHLDQVIEMAKKGAKFYYEKVLINSDKAIALLKEHKNLTIHSESTNNSNYKVWISKKPIKK